jgi:hypothetical protein
MTLSRFLRDYLYFALGGNRKGPLRRYMNLAVTMLLGGLWHGANWTFVIWGALHGVYLIVNHLWLALCKVSRPLAAVQRAPGIGLVSGAVTFLAVVVGWVFFRSPDLTTAGRVLEAMAGHNGIVIPEGLEFALRPAVPLLEGLGVRFGAGSGSLLLSTWLWVTGLLICIFFAPNTQQIMARFEPVLDAPIDLGRAGRWVWAPSARWAIAVAIVLFVGIVSITRISEFLYWQF